MTPMTICLDPGHGMSNRRIGVYDTGATERVKGVEITEAEIVMDWADELRGVLMGMGHAVVRTRKDMVDPAPLAERARIAKRFHCDVLISLHCNFANGRAQGTETFYRGPTNKPLAKACNDAVCSTLGTRNRGVKLEAQSQHKTLAVLNFPRACLIELGFLDFAPDRHALLNPHLMLLACQALADAITS